MIPKTKTLWTDKVKTAEGDDRLQLITEIPVVVWFSNIPGVKRIHHLIKVWPRLGTDLWVIQGYDNESGGVRIFTTCPRPLEVCLRYPRLEDGWVLCEFPTEADFYRAALGYLES